MQSLPQDFALPAHLISAAGDEPREKCVSKKIFTLKRMTLPKIRLSLVYNGQDRISAYLACLLEPLFEFLINLLQLFKRVWCDLEDMKGNSTIETIILVSQ